MKRPKTGLAARMRAWMRSCNQPYTYHELYDGLSGAVPMSQIKSAMSNFVARGEVERMPNGRWRYNHEWRNLRVMNVERRIYKAMYITPQWSVNDIIRLVSAGQSYVYRIVARLRATNVVEQVGVRSMSPRPGSEYVYRVRHREQFRKEYVK